jgi:hypothetical protein
MQQVNERLIRNDIRVVEPGYHACHIVAVTLIVGAQCARKKAAGERRKRHEPDAKFFAGPE